MGERWKDWTTTVRSWDELRALLDEPLTCPGLSLQLARHGETVNNANRTVSGASDVELTSTGRDQARALAEEIDRSYDAVFVSTLSRSQETAELALAAAGVGPVELIADPRLSERSMGELEGEVARMLPAYDEGDLTWAPPGGEPYISVTRRALSYLADLFEQSRASGGSLSVIAFSHVGPMRILLAILRGEGDPVAVMTGQYANARLEHVLAETLTWPAFVGGQWKDDRD